MITDIDKFADSLKKALNKGGIPFDWRLSDKILYEFAESFKRCPIQYFSNRSHGACFTIDGRELDGLDLS